MSLPPNSGMSIASPALSILRVRHGDPVLLLARQLGRARVQAATGLGASPRRDVLVEDGVDFLQGFLLKRVVRVAVSRYHIEKGLTPEVSG